MECRSRLAIFSPTHDWTHHPWRACMAFKDLDTRPSEAVDDFHRVVAATTQEAKLSACASGIPQGPINSLCRSEQLPVGAEGCGNGAARDRLEVYVASGAVLHEILLRPRPKLFAALAACLPNRHVSASHRPALPLHQQPGYVASIRMPGRRGAWDGRNRENMLIRALRARPCMEIT